MEILGGIALALVLLALVGVVTVAAIPLMAVIGLLTEMSFKRVFFTSFALALLAPIALGVMIGEAIEDGSIQREIQRDFSESISQAEFSDSDLQEIRQIRESLSDERIQQIERVFEQNPQIRQALPPELVEIIESEDVAQDVVVIEGNAEEVTPDPDPDPVTEDPVADNPDE